MDGDDIREALNETDTPFMCYNCGNEFENVSKNSTKDEAVAVLKYSHGEPTTHDQPGEPGGFYFECIDCYNNTNKKNVVDHAHPPHAINGCVG